MLKYLISTIEACMIPAVLLGLLAAYLPKRYERHGRSFLIGGSILGFAAAAVMAYMKNKTKLVRGDAWNIRIFTVTILVFLLFLVFDLAVFTKKDSDAARLPAPLLGSMLALLQLFYALPDVIAYPYTIVLNGDSLFSTGFLYRIIGVSLGAGLSVLTCAAIRHAAVRCDLRLTGAVLKTSFALIVFQMALKIVSILRARKILPKGTLFAWTSFSANHASWYLYAILLLAFVTPLIMLFKSHRVTEPYENPAELRKIRAARRTLRRWCVATLCCILAAFLNVTAVKAYAYRPVELSAIEACAVEDGNVVVTFEQVADGHLHRFAYTTAQGAEVRFIVIKKPNSSAYGIGLDACEICGETGYYERGGQVICNRCDVVMNINTIGFKGGCNPIVVEYSIADGRILIPVSALDTEEYNKLFK